MSEETATLLKFAMQLANLSARAILPLFRANIPVDIKPGEHWDPVTEGDRAAERVIRDHIQTAYPTHGIIGEEFGTKAGSSAYTWVLDPIDGTRAFVIGMPTWATLIGLYRDGKPLLGIMSQPYVGEMFYGSPAGSYLAHGGTATRLRVSQTIAVSTARGGTTAPHLYDAHPQFETLRNKLQMMRYGGDCYFFSLVAAGHLDIAIDAGLHIYDIAALIPIIENAGGVVGTWDGKDPSKGGNILAAASQKLFAQAVSIMQGKS